MLFLLPVYVHLGHISFYILFLIWCSSCHIISQYFLPWWSCYPIMLFLPHILLQTFSAFMFFLSHLFHKLLSLVIFLRHFLLQTFSPLMFVLSYFFNKLFSLHAVLHTFHFTNFFFLGILFLYFLSQFISSLMFILPHLFFQTCLPSYSSFWVVFHKPFPLCSSRGISVYKLLPLTLWHFLLQTVLFLPHTHFHLAL